MYTENCIVASAQTRSAEAAIGAIETSGIQTGILPLIPFAIPGVGAFVALMLTARGGPAIVTIGGATIVGLAQDKPSLLYHPALTREILLNDGVTLDVVYLTGTSLLEVPVSSAANFWDEYHNRVLADPKVGDKAFSILPK